MSCQPDGPEVEREDAPAGTGQTAAQVVGLGFGFLSCTPDSEHLGYVGYDLNLKPRQSDASGSRSQGPNPVDFADFDDLRRGRYSMGFRCYRSPQRLPQRTIGSAAYESKALIEVRAHHGVLDAPDERNVWIAIGRLAVLRRPRVNRLICSRRLEQQRGLVDLEPAGFFPFRRGLLEHRCGGL